MSPDEIHVTAEKIDDVSVTLQSPPVVDLTMVSTPDLHILAAGNVGATGRTGPQGPPGPEGPQGEWLALTQSEYDALTPKNSLTLYVIVD